MTEPWASFGPDQDTPGLASVLVAQAMRADEREAARYQREQDAKRAEAEDRHDARLHHWLLTRANQLSMQGRTFNLNDPASMVMGMDEMAAMVFDSQDREAARNEMHRAIADGRLHVLNVPASEMSAPPPSAEELEAERADLAIQSARYRTEHQGLVARLRHWRKEKAVAP